MCVPIGLDTATSLFSTVVKGVNEYNSIKSNNEYRTQVALNNAKTAQNEALRQKQLGIEKARLERISGLNEVSKLKAQNAAGNLDSDSMTNQFAYQDVLNYSDYNANLVKKEYDLNANNYFKQANSYLNQANNYKKDYKKSMYNFSINALGNAKKVATDWYEDIQDGGVL